ncbi:MAG: hypothetical protein ACMUFK_02240, partial [Thermoplasmatota archaeon]
DGDTTYPAELIPGLLDQLLSEGLDFISCDRIRKAEKGAFTTTHAFGNWVLKVTMNILFGTDLHDSQSGMWVFRKRILDGMKLTSDGMPLSEEIKIEAFKNPGIKAKEVSVPYRIRKGDKALNTWKDGIKNELFLFKKKFRPAYLGSGEDFTDSVK